MDIASWAAVAGFLLLVMALSDSVLARLPLSTSMLYLAVGVAASPLWLDWIRISPTTHPRELEHVAEIVVLISLFGSGLKMSVGLGDGRWLLPLRLALLSMVITVGLIAAAGVAWLGLSLGAAILLGGILAPTDPVLASDVQIAEPTDRDRLRFSLTGEAGLNDGTAFPFVMLGLGLLGLHDLGPMTPAQAEQFKAEARQLHEEKQALRQSSGGQLTEEQRQQFKQRKQALRAKMKEAMRANGRQDV